MLWGPTLSWLSVMLVSLEVGERHPGSPSYGVRYDGQALGQRRFRVFGNYDERGAHIVSYRAHDQNDESISRVSK